MAFELNIRGVVAPLETGFEWAIDELKQICRIPKEIQKLITKMNGIKAVLKDAEEKQITRYAVRFWLWEVKQVVLDAEDLIVGLTTAVQSMGLHRANKVVITWFGNDITGRVLKHRVFEITDKLDWLSFRQHMLGLRPSILDYRGLELSPREKPTGSLLPDETFVVGRDKEKAEILERLLSPACHSSSSNINFSVLAIVGMGGIGKTTLARLVFNDERVKRHFELMMWVRVSNIFDPTRLLRDMIEAAFAINGKPGECKITDWGSMQRRLLREVEGKTFLLVLDDVREAAESMWEELFKPLHFANKGSKVLVTTRNRASLHKIQGWIGPPMLLNGLSRDETWPLLRRCALSGVIDDSGTTSAEYFHLEPIGRDIVERLGGSPLAARTIGSFLNYKLDLQHWNTVLKSEIWWLKQWEEGIQPAVLLSYQYLDGDLKQCFAYCSLFPKGFTFDREDLVQLWEAQCFIRRSTGTRMAMGGSRYFDHLLRLSFFEFETSYAMHDCKHDLAEHVSGGDIFRLEDEVYAEIPLTVRHISFCLSKCDPAKLNSLSRYEKLQKLRTLLFLQRFEFDGLGSHVLDELFSKLKLLRVLGLCHCQIKEVPESIGGLKHLRYLDLSGNHLLQHLPESLGNLYNLQTLKVEGCGGLSALPARTSELTNLRHLQADDELVSRIDGLGKLTSLEELRVRGRKVRELGGMSMLRKLSIWNLEEVESKEEVVQTRLHGMECLEVLRLEWSTQRQRDAMPMTREEVEEEEGVLQALRPNGDSIEELHIRGYRGVKSPDWMETPTVASFSKLTHVVVECCPSWQALPSSLSQMPLLESVAIASMPRWEQWTGPVWHGDHSNSQQDPCSDTPYFPCLHELQIVDCPKLGELLLLPPKLRNLRLEKVGLSRLPSLWGRGRSGRETEAASCSESSSAPAELSSLHIRRCRNLTTVTGLLQHQLRTLKEVVIEMCPELVSFPERGFGHMLILKKLWIVRCPRIQWPPSALEEELLPLSLKELKIEWCGHATGWWWRAGLRRVGTLSSLSLRGSPATEGTFTTRLALKV